MKKLFLIVLFLFFAISAAWAAECTQPSCFQPRDKELTGLADQVSAADRVPYFTDAEGNMALAPLTAFGRSLLAASDSSILGFTLEVPRVTVATLPLPPITANQVVVVTDALTSASCLVAGGTKNVTCQWTGSAWVVIGGGGGDIGGSITEVQFHDGVFAGDPGMTYNKTTNVLTVTGEVITPTVTASADVVVAGQSVCREDGTNCPAAIGDDQTAAEVPFTPDGTIASTNVQTAIVEVRNEAQPLDATLTAWAAFNTNGCLAQTAADTFTGRTLTGANNKITVNNGNCVAGNPTFTLGADAVQITQTNVYGAFLQNFSAATMMLPMAAGAAPATNGLIQVDSTSWTVEVGLNGANVTLLTSAGNAATATALAANGTNCSSTVGVFAKGTAANGDAECDDVVLTSSAAPGAGTVEYPGQIHKDTRAYSCATQAGLTSIGQTVGGNFAPIGAETDGYVTVSDGVDTSIPCGADTLRVSGSGGISFYQYNGTGAFTNQPTNDGWEAVSSNAGDTTQFLRVCSTLTGGTARDLTCETIQLNGTTFISSVTTTYADIFTVRLCTTAACVANTTAAGTITLREASGNATITTIAPAASKAAHQDITVAVLSSTLNINGLTTDAAVDNAADFVPYYDASEGANNKVLLESLGPRKIYFDAGAMSPVGTCAAPTEQELGGAGGPTTWAFACTNATTSIFHGKVRLPVTITTATFTVGVHHAASEVVTKAGTFSAMCRADGTAINTTYGTGVDTDVVTAAVANQYQEQASTAVTPNGTCSKGAMLFWRYVHRVSGDANSANSKFLQVTMAY